MDGKEIVFPGPVEHLPGPEFLTHHNDEFFLKEEEGNIQLKAAAEPKDYDSQDSDLTITHHL